MRPRRPRAATISALIAPAVAAVVMSGCGSRHYNQVSCTASHQSIFVLEAQAVPSATLIPCTLPLPGGWSYGGSEVRSGLARFWLDSDRAGAHAAEVRLTRTCDVAGATQLPPASGSAPVRRYQEPAARQPHAKIGRAHV